MFRFAISADGSGNCTSETFQTLNLYAHRYYFANSRPEPRRTLAHFRWLRNELRFFSKLSYETSESWARMNMKSSDSREPISLLGGENLFLIITLDRRYIWIRKLLLPFDRAAIYSSLVLRFHFVVPFVPTDWLDFISSSKNYTLNREENGTSLILKQYKKCEIL